jgi:hypothetical protein
MSMSLLLSTGAFLTAWGRTHLNYAAIRGGSRVARIGLLGTSIEEGTLDISWMGHSFQGIMNSRMNVEWYGCYAVGGATLATIGTTQLNNAIADKCNMIIIGGPVNDLPNNADSIATCKTVAQAIVTSCVQIWQKCMTLGIVPIQMAPSTSNLKNAKGTLYVMRMLARAASRMGVAFITAPYAIMVSPVTGQARTGRVLDDVHPNEAGAILIGNAVGDWFAGTDRYSPWLGYGRHDIGWNLGTLVWEYSALSMIEGNANVDAGGLAMVTHLDRILTGGTVTAVLATDAVVTGAWVDQTRTTVGEIGASKASLSLGVNGLAGDLIAGYYRYRTSAMAGSRSRGRNRLSSLGFSMSRDQRMVGESNYADPGYVWPNFGRLVTTNSVRLALNCIDDGAGTNTGVISMAQPCVLNFGWMDRELDAWNLGIPAAA